jgi:hypothetical protein
LAIRGYTLQVPDTWPSIGGVATNPKSSSTDAFADNALLEAEVVALAEVDVGAVLELQGTV